MLKVLIAGHSYIERLAGVIDRVLQAPFIHSPDNINQVEFLLFSIPGACVHHFSNPNPNSPNRKDCLGVQFWEVATNFDPDVILYFIGGNDLLEEVDFEAVKQSVRDLHACTLASAPTAKPWYFAISDTEFRFHSKESEPTTSTGVAGAQASKGRYFVTQEKYNKLRKGFNNFLHNKIPSLERAFYFRLDKTKFDFPDNYEADGIHMNEIGLKLLWERFNNLVLYLLRQPAFSHLAAPQN